MNEQSWVIGAGTTVYAVAAVMGVLFPVTYSVMTKWWRSPARREALYIIALSLSLAAVFGYLVAANAGWLGTLDSAHRAVVRLIVAAIGALVLVGLVVLLVWAQTEQRRKARLLNLSRKDDHG